VRAADGGGGLGHAEVLDLAGLDELLDRSGDAAMPYGIIGSSWS
jgi:hypothetical protein